MPAKLFTFSNRGGANNETKIHPTQKPCEVLDFIIKTYLKKGDTIIDTHSGSNSLAVSVMKANMLSDMDLKLTSIEIDEKYYKDSVNRIDAFVRECSPAEKEGVTTDGQYKLI